MTAKQKRSRAFAVLLVVIVAMLLVWKVTGNRPAQDAGSVAASPPGTPATANTPTSAPLMIGEFYLGGDVPRPGAYTLTGRAITLRQALIMAQFGPQQAKDAAYVSIYRRKGTDDEELIKVDAAAVYEVGGGIEQLQPDDQVIVVMKPKPQGAR